MRCSLGPILLLAAGCASSPGVDLYDPGDPTPEQLALLRAAEASYRAGEPGFAELRDQLAADPVACFWLTRMIVRDLLYVRDAKLLGVEQQNVRPVEIPGALRSGRGPGDAAAVVRAAAGARNPIEQRALQQVDALGAAAVPCIVEDLARHKQAFVRQLGVELLARLGADALPGVERLAASRSALDRRTAAQALGAMTPPSALILQLLRALAADSDFGVRGAAVRALEHGGLPAGQLLRKILAEDKDPFVQRSAAIALRGHRDVPSAEALIAFLERCKRERDQRGVDAAQESLQQLAHSSGPRTADAWRRWLASFDPQAEGR